MVERALLFVAWFGLVLCAWPLDRAVENFVPRLPPKSLLRAIDTAVHGLIGGFSYWMACIICPNLVLRISLLLPYLDFGNGGRKNRASQEPQRLDMFFSFCIAFVVSCFIDLDHIVKDVLQIMNSRSPGHWKRGWLHLSLPPLLLTCTFYSSAILLQSLSCVTCGALTILSVLSHHIRDGIHHGLDLYPLGKTLKLPYWLYFLTTSVLPVLAGELSSAVIQLMKTSPELSSGNQHIV